MPKYDVWLTVRGIGGRTSLMETVSAKNKGEAEAIVRQTWYGESPEIKQVKVHKARAR
jgi:hypothetical protein